METNIKKKYSMMDRLGVATWRAVFNVVTTVIRPGKVKFPGTMTEHLYGTHPDERIDVIEAADNKPKLPPVVYIHGGGWVCGQKEMFNKQLARLAEAGHPVFNVEYPLAPENPYPAALRSLVSAVAWIREQYPQYETVHLAGDSAGGNLATMLGIFISNPKLASNLGEDIKINAPINTPKVRSITTMYGVLDRISWIEEKFPAGSLFMRNYAGNASFAPQVDKAHAITPMDLQFDKLPPVFIATGSKDKLATSSRLFAERLDKEARSVKYIVYPDSVHGFFSWGAGSDELLNDMIDFLSQQSINDIPD